jgi:hypothetical protein
MYDLTGISKEEFWLSSVTNPGTGRNEPDGVQRVK